MDESPKPPPLVRSVRTIASGQPLSDDEASILLDELFMPIINRVSYSLPFFQEVTGLDEKEICGELWLFASTPGPQTGKTLWQKALETVAARTDSPEEEAKQLKAYLLVSLKRWITKTLMQGSTAAAVVSLIVGACEQTKEIQINKHLRGAYHACIRPAGNEDLPQLSEADLQSLSPELSIPAPKGKRVTRSGAVLPTPRQVGSLIKQIFARKKGLLPVRLLVDLLFTVYNIPRQTTMVNIDGERQDSDGERPSDHLHGEQLKKISVPAPQQGVGRREIVERHSQRLLEKIAAVDKKPISDDDPASGGKMAKLLLDFCLWQGMAFREDPSMHFGYKIYAEKTATPDSTLNDRYTRKLLPLLQNFCSENGLTADDLRAVLAHLRNRFAKRKPENLVDPDFQP